MFEHSRKLKEGKIVVAVIGEPTGFPLAPPGPGLPASPAGPRAPVIN
jgi:hypothetical protein